MTLPHAVLVSLPSILDMKHAAEIYGAIVGCAVSLWLVSVVVNSVLDHVKHARAERRAYIVRRMMDGEDL